MSKQSSYEGFTEDERAANIMICVSRAHSDELEIDR